VRLAILGRNIRPPWNEAVKNMGNELARQLSTLGHEVHLITDGGSLSGYDRGVHVHTISQRDFWRSAIKTILMLESEKLLDLVHIHNLVIHRSFSPFLGILRRRSKLPVVAYCCQLPGLSFSNWVEVFRKDPWEALSNKIGMLAPPMTSEWTIRTVDKLIVSSSFIGRQLSAAKPKRKIDIIPPFLDDNKFKVQLEPPRLNSHPPFLLYLGSHKVLRGEDDFLRVLALMRSECQDLEGVAITPHPIPRRVTRLMRAKGLEGAVKFVHRGADVDVPFLMKAAKLYVFTGLSPIGSIDPPLSVIESLILGTPVASYDTGSIGEYLSSDYLATYGDYPTLAKKGSDILHQESRARPRTELMQQFSSSYAVKQFISSYEALVA